MTYSIVARDPRSGELGVAVQSRWPCVGAGVVWAEPGVGAVATQSFTEISYGPLGLEAMRAGTSAPDALADLLAEDPRACGAPGRHGRRDRPVGGLTPETAAWRPPVTSRPRTCRSRPT